MNARGHSPTVMGLTVDDTQGMGKVLSMQGRRRHWWRLWCAGNHSFCFGSGRTNMTPMLKHLGEHSEPSSSPYTHACTAGWHTTPAAADGGLAALRSPTPCLAAETLAATATLVASTKPSLLHASVYAHRLYAACRTLVSASPPMYILVVGAFARQRQCNWKIARETRQRRL